MYEESLKEARETHEMWHGNLLYICFSMCVLCFCFYVPMSHCASLCLTVSLYRYVSMSLRLYVYLCHYVSVSLRPRVCVALSICVSVGLNLSLCRCASLSVRLLSLLSCHSPYTVWCSLGNAPAQRAAACLQSQPHTAHHYRVRIRQVE